MDALANNLLTTNVLGKIDLSKGDMQFLKNIFKVL